jgi:hypothetical protein
MTPEESIEDIAFDIDCQKMFKELANKYKNSSIGFSAKESVELLEKRIKELIHRHKSLFDEKVDRKSIEAIL